VTSIENSIPSVDAYLQERTILPNFIPIRFETMEALAFLKSVVPTTTTTIITITEISSDMKLVPGPTMRVSAKV